MMLLLDARPPLALPLCFFVSWPRSDHNFFTGAAVFGHSSSTVLAVFGLVVFRLTRRFCKNAFSPPLNT